MKTVLLFAGQGSQYVGMGKDLFDNFSIAKEYFGRAEEILKSPVRDICFNGPEEKLKMTENTQPLVLLVSYIVYKILEKEGIQSDTFAGFSLGEYSALTSAGVIKFEDGIGLVRKRGLIMDEAVKDIDGGMAAILGLEDNQVEEICKRVEGVVVPANYNSPGQLVISGEKKAVEKACGLAEEMGAKKTVILNVSGPFHSPLLEKASNRLKEVLDKIEFLPLNGKKIYSNVTANYHIEEDIKELLVKQMYSPVKWRKTIENLISEGFDTYIEIGPGKTLAGFMKSIDRSKTSYSVGTVESVQKLLENIKK